MFSNSRVIQKIKSYISSPHTASLFYTRRKTFGYLLHCIHAVISVVQHGYEDKLKVCSVNCRRSARHLEFPNFRYSQIARSCVQCGDISEVQTVTKHLVVKVP